MEGEELLKTGKLHLVSNNHGCYVIGFNGQLFHFCEINFYIVVMCVLVHNMETIFHLY